MCTRGYGEGAMKEQLPENTSDASKSNSFFETLKD
jgi:hypothetical protein